MLKDLFWCSKPIGQALIDLGFISVSDLRKFLRLQRKLFLDKNKKIPLGKLLIKKKLISK